MDAALANVIAENFVTQEAADYLEARGLKTCKLIYGSALNEEAFDTKVIQPFLQEGGFEDAAKKAHKNTGDAVFVGAALMCVYRDARDAAAPPPQALMPLLPTYPTPVQQRPATTPTTLEAGDWKKRVEAFESFWTPRRKFPNNLLVGADKVLARMVHEFSTTRNFTPVELGEIIHIHHFTATGQVNMPATRRDALRPVGWIPGNSSEAPQLAFREAVADPRGFWQVTDALQAIKWAIVFAGWTEDDYVAGAWTDFFANMMRTRPGQLEAIKSFYHASACMLALKMRDGDPFATASADIIADRNEHQQFFDNFMPERKSSVGEDKGKGKGKGKRNDLRIHTAPRPYDQQPYTARSRSPGRPAAGASAPTAAAPTVETAAAPALGRPSPVPSAPRIARRRTSTATQFAGIGT